MLTLKNTIEYDPILKSSILVTSDFHLDRSTFHCHMDAPVNLFLWIHQHVACVLPLVRVLHIGQLQCAVVLKGTLAMVKREQVGILIPLNRVVRVTNDATVNVCVPSSDGSDIFHWSNTGRTCCEKELSVHSLRKSAERLMYYVSIISFSTISYIF